VTTPGGRGEWFGAQLRRAYADRHEVDVKVHVEERVPLSRPVILNCLDGLYGHALLKLLNVQHHLDKGDEVAVLVPAWLRWMVPGDVPAVWTVDVPLRRAWHWFDPVDRHLHELLARYDEASLCVALPHPHPSDVDIERFTGVRPASLRNAAGGASPTVTFVWRDDRAWGGSVKAQARRMKAVARLIRRTWPAADIAVAGVDGSRIVVGEVTDLRVERPDADAEQAWCRRYAASDVVFGMHGSNMLLPSAHARVVVELLPEDRYGNLGQDLLLPEPDPRLALLRARFLPDDSTVQRVAALITSAVQDVDALVVTSGAAYARHEDADLAVARGNRWQSRLAAARR
jgi:hypothetical protein